MKRQSSGPILSAVFVDYDNIYLSLKRKSEEAAKRFAKDALSWVKEIETGRLITPTNSYGNDVERRIVMNRCYGNPVPRRNSSDNSTDMNSFPFVRHHFLRAGFEIVDCPPLTAQLKNSSDIRMVMDVRDYLTHDTYFDEFVILSGDADFTPVLHRLRAHARRTVIFANDYTAAPYTAISDGEVREADLISLLLEGKLPGQKDGEAPAIITASVQNETIAQDIIAEVVAAVRTSAVPLPLEALADRAMRALGHDKTIASNWAGAGSFRELLLKALPDDIRLTDQPPYLAFEVRRTLPVDMPVEQPKQIAARAEPRLEPRPESRSEQRQDFRPDPRLEIRSERIERPGFSAAAAYAEPQAAPRQQQPVRTAAQLRETDAPPVQAQPRRPAVDPRLQSQAMIQAPQHAQPPAPVARPSQAVVQQAPVAAQPAPRGAEQASELQQSIARIHDASQAPPLSPPEYRILFDAMAQEINERGLLGAQTLTNVMTRARDVNVELRRDDVRFILEVVSEQDPWFEQGASASLFSSRFRNFVAGRCRDHGLNLSADEIDLIDAWFTGAGLQAAPAAQQMAVAAQQRASAPAQRQPQAPAAAPQQDRWWSNDDARLQGTDGRAPAPNYGRPATPQQANDTVEGEFGATEEFPRIVKNRLRG
jgi:NYN domain